MSDSYERWRKRADESLERSQLRRQTDMDPFERMAWNFSLFLLMFIGAAAFVGIMVSIFTTA